MSKVTEQKITTDSVDSAHSTLTKTNPVQQKAGRIMLDNHYKREQGHTGSKTTSQEKSDKIVQNLVSYSQKMPFPVKLPIEDADVSLEHSLLHEFMRGNPSLFQRPSPIGGIRKAVEVEHRGLGEEKRQDNGFILKKRRMLHEQSEQNRRDRRNYYEQLLRELNNSSYSLGKRTSEGTGFNALGVPALSVSPEELREKAKTFELGNYPTSAEVGRTRLRALNDETLFNGCRILDFGCSDGALLFEIAKAVSMLILN